MVVEVQHSSDHAVTTVRLWSGVRYVMAHDVYRQLRVLPGQRWVPLLDDWAMQGSVIRYGRDTVMC